MLVERFPALTGSLARNRWNRVTASSMSVMPVFQRLCNFEQTVKKTLCRLTELRWCQGTTLPSPSLFLRCEGAMAATVALLL